LKKLITISCGFYANFEKSILWLNPKNNMKFEKNQPWRLWFFVLSLNVVGFIGLYLLKERGIDIYALHGAH